MPSEQPVCDEVGLELCLVAVFGHFEGRRHNPRVVDQTVKRAFFGEDEFSSGYDTGK